MIQINLVPEEYRIREYRRTPIFSIALSFSVIFLVYVGVNGIFQHIKARKQIRIAESNLKAMESTAEEVKALSKKLTDKLKPEVVTISTLLTNEINWAQVLYLISKKVPNNVWLSSLEVNDTSESWTLTLTGFALPVTQAAAIATVGEFTTKVKWEMITLLTREGIDPDIELLTTTKQKQADRIEIVEFKASYVRDK